MHVRCLKVDECACENRRLAEVNLARLKAEQRDEGTRYRCTGMYLNPVLSGDGCSLHVLCCLQKGVTSGLSIGAGRSKRTASSNEDSILVVPASGP